MIYNFNPRSHERSDVFCLCLIHIDIYFNPRSHERSDYFLNFMIIADIPISIHAPTRGATRKPTMCLAQSRFQSTLPREERPVAQVPLPKFSKFQSTLPREERPSVRRISQRLIYFNPRSHERSDKDGTTTGRTITKFQSTLPREERQ